MGDSEVELQLYREKIVAELERRMLVLHDVERRLGSAQFALTTFNQTARVMSASTARRQVEYAHGIRLRRDVKALEQERQEAQADLERAEVRLKEVDLRLDELSREPEQV